MKRAVILCLGTALCAAPLALAAATAADKPATASKAGYKAPRNIFGQPDLGDAWSNATLTPESRPASLGDRLVYTPDEVKKLEAAVVDEVAEGNKSTDPNAPAPKQGGEVTPNVRPEFAAAGGNVGGYNRGWLDPGSSVMRVHGEPRTSFLTTPNGRPPARKATSQQAAGGGRGGGGGGGLGSFDNPESRSLGERCIVSFGRNGGPPMLPNGFYNNNYHFVQGKDEVVIEVEMVHDVRHIALNRKEHLPSNLRPWFGDSIGHYEGDTLVVETTNIPRSQAYNGAWENLKVTERFTRVGPDRLLYQYVIDDPTSWDKPWGGEYEFSPLSGRVLEYACHEGNYALEGMLAGARQAEADAKKTAAR
ncbi:MAG: hypothetical protein JWO33_910 [Caulobacteraceae bacterium]|nr:hypothetical protein [Caulobacteraceae bacterium]